MLLKPRKISKKLGVIFILDRVKSNVWCSNCKYWDWNEQTQRQCENVFDIRNESILSKCVRILKNYPNIRYNYCYVVKKD